MAAATKKKSTPVLCFFCTDNYTTTALPLKAHLLPPALQMFRNHAFACCDECFARDASYLIDAIIEYRRNLFIQSN